jgi:photosystem II stability/assembly factor-like uncharacterized protein
MTLAALSLIPLAFAAGVPPVDWIAVDAGTCSGTDVDFSDARHGFATCAFSDAMTTDDGGLSWTVFPTGLQQSLLFAHAQSPTSLYAARLGLYRSIDGGSNWEEIGGLSANGGSVFDVHFGDDGHLVAIQGGVLRYSDDQGASWEVGYPGKFGVFFDELHFPSPLVGYAIGGNTSEQGSIGSVLRSVDGGVGWTLLAFPHGEITAGDFDADDHGVVATLQGAVYETGDGGASWQPLAALPDAAILLDLAMRDAAHWIGVSIQGCLYETHDAGQSWQAGYCDPAERALAALTLDGGAPVAVGNDGLALYENRIFRDGFEGSAKP